MTIPNLERRSVLVTGGAGFIGSHLVDALLERGASVRVLDDFSTGSRENLAHCLDRLTLIEGDIRDPAICIEACRGADLIFHQAALGSVPRSMKDPATTIAVNVSGTANVFAAAREAGVKRVIYASSSSVYGDSPKLPKREGEEGRPLSPYALSKVMNEELADVFGRAFGMELIGLRYFNVYGPRQRPEGPYAAVIPRFVNACSRGERPIIYGDGEQTRDFTSVSDAVAANLLAAGAAGESCGRAYNVASGSRISINELAAMICGRLGKALQARHEPARPGDARDSQADLSAVRNGLGFEPAHDLESGVARLLSPSANALPADGSSR